MKWEDIRKKVYKRDNNTCRRCKKKVKGSELHAHHIIPKQKSNDNSLPNLVSLCNKCHRTTENKYNKYGLTRYERDWIEENMKYMEKNIDLEDQRGELWKK